MWAPECKQLNPLGILIISRESCIPLCYRNNATNLSRRMKKSSRSCKWRKDHEKALAYYRRKSWEHSMVSWGIPWEAREILNLIDLPLRRRGQFKVGLVILAQRPYSCPHPVARGYPQDPLGARHLAHLVERFLYRILVQLSLSSFHCFLLPPLHTDTDAFHSPL